MGNAERYWGRGEDCNAGSKRARLRVSPLGDRRVLDAEGSRGEQVYTNHTESRQLQQKTRHRANGLPCRAALLCNAVPRGTASRLGRKQPKVHKIQATFNNQAWRLGPSDFAAGTFQSQFCCTLPCAVYCVRLLIHHWLPPNLAETMRQRKQTRLELLLAQVGESNARSREKVL